MLAWISSLGPFLPLQVQIKAQAYIEQEYVMIGPAESQILGTKKLLVS